MAVIIQLAIQIVSNGICAPNFKGNYKIVELVWFHQNYNCLSLVRPTIAISRCFVSKLLFYYLGHEKLCFRHESVRLQVKM